MERRSGKDRRKYIDPRYRNAAYPDFFDRRKGGDRRKVSYQDFFGHPTRKVIILIGAVVAVPVLMIGAIIVKSVLNIEE